MCTHDQDGSAWRTVLFYDVVVCSLSSWKVVLDMIRCRLEQCSKSASL